MTVDVWPRAVGGSTNSELMSGLLSEANAAAPAVPTAARGGRTSGGALASLLLGQLISLLITGTGAFSALLAANGVSMPAAQAGINYALLVVHFLFSRVWDLRSDCCHPERPRVAAWRYAVWAVTDFEANYLVVLAYQHTSVASVMLLDCFAIPCAMAVSRFTLGARYRWGHVCSCLVCVVGLSLTVLSDTLSGRAVPAPHGHAWLGDLLVLAGAALYGFSNVQQEWILKHGGPGRRAEALGMLGLWGSLVALVQTPILEGAALATVVWTPSTLLSLLGFQICLFCIYVLTSAFLLRSDAMLFNLSLLTSDVYSVLFTWLVQHQQLSWLYAAAFCTTLSGVVGYTFSGGPEARRAEGDSVAPVLLVAEEKRQSA